MTAKVREEIEEQVDDGDDEEDFQINSVEDLMAVINRFSRNGNRNGGGRPFVKRQGNGAPPPPKPVGERLTRKCPNCGKNHPMSLCPEPRLADGDRKCWTCGKKGCRSATCPEKGKKPGAVKAVSDGTGGIPIFGLGSAGNIQHVDHEGYTKVVRKSPGRPMPTQATFGDFLSHNVFDSLCCVDHSSSSTPPPPTATSARTSRPRSNPRIATTSCSAQCCAPASASTMKGSSVMAADRTHGPQSSSVSATDRHHGPRDDEDAEVANTTENIMKAAQKAVEEDWNEVDEIQAEKERAQREYALKERAARSLELNTATSLRPLARPMAKSLLPDLQRSIEAQLIDIDAALREEDAGTATRPTTLIKEMQEIVEKQQAALLLDH